MCMDFNALITSILGTVVGGIVLALLFFWAREKLFPMPDINGRWYLEMRTVNTSYSPYKEMILRYEAMLWRIGNQIQGTVEKYYEISSNGEREFVGENRTRGVVGGYIEKNYFTKDRLFLHVVEDGHGRESTHFYDVIVRSNTEMIGAFSSMVAKQDGEAAWQRHTF